MEPYIKNIIEKNLSKIKTYKKMLGGLSNKLYKCKLENMDSEILIKQYGDSEFIIRDIELAIFKALEKYNFSPKLYLSFNNGYIMEYLNCTPIKYDDFVKLKYKDQLIENLIKYHQIHINYDKKESIIIKYGNKILETLIIDDLLFTDIKSEWKTINEQIILLNEPLYLCHNDLQQYNLLINKYQKLYFIDFEYSGYNTILYEIANLFNEFLFNYDNEKDPYFRYIKENKINEEDKLLFITEYYKKNNKSIDLQYIKKNFILYELQSHLFWTIWSLNLINNSKITFNYYEYAIKRYKLYKESL
jgi:thiamine kinase-like enzyme